MKPEVAPVAGGDVLRPGDVPDPAVTEADHVLHREPDALAIVDGDRWQRAVLEAAVDEHDRRAAGRDLGQQVDVEAGGGGDEAIDLTGHAAPHMCCARARGRCRC